MYKDSRPTETGAATASTPELWAATFRRATRMNAWRRFRFSLAKEWSLIERHISSGGYILDAGCGFGEWVSFLTQKGYRAEGLDFSKELIGRLRDVYPDLSWTQGNVTSLPYHADTFDGLVSWGVIEHEETGPLAALSEFHRVLKQGATVIVTVPLDSPAQRRSAGYLYHRTARQQTFFQYFFRVDELADCVRSVGFDVVDVGVLPNAVLQLVSPRLAARLRGLPFRAANFLVSALLSRVPRYCVMTYCVGRKRAEKEICDAHDDEQFRSTTSGMPRCGELHKPAASSKRRARLSNLCTGTGVTVGERSRTFIDTNRPNDHVRYHQDQTKLKEPYAPWAITKNLKSTIAEICASGSRRQSRA